MADTPTAGLHPGEHAEPAGRPGTGAAGLHAGQDRDHRAHRHFGDHVHAHPSPHPRGTTIAPRLTPLASDGGTRLLKTALALGVLWIAVAWALGWFGA